MKTLRFLILVWLAATMLCEAQQTVSVTGANVNPAVREAAIEAKQAELAALPKMQRQALLLPSVQDVPSAPIAEAITPDIQNLANGLQDDPVRIFNYVHDHIRHILYFGSKKGAELTLLEKSGNDFDQCALLVALLRAAGYTNAPGTDHGAGYEFGWMKLPYDNPSHWDLHHWLRLNLTNTNWNYTSNYLDTLIRVYRGNPDDAAIWGNNTFAFQRIWVTLTIGSTTYYLDPSFKVSEPIPGINLSVAMGYANNTALSNALMSAAAGTDTGNYTSNLDETAVRGVLTGCTTNLLNYLQSNMPNASVEQVLSGWQIVPSTNTTLPTSLDFPTYTWGGQMPILTWTYEPTNMMSSISISFDDTNFAAYFPQLEGQPLTLTYDDIGFVTLYLGETEVAGNYAVNGAYDPATIVVSHPVGYWDTNNNTFVDTGALDQTNTSIYDSYPTFNPPYFNAYNITYGFEPDWGWLQKREQRLAYLESLGSDPYGNYYGDQTIEALNVMGLYYQLQQWYVEQMLAAQDGVLPENYHVVGRIAQEDGYGYYLDIFMELNGDTSSYGADAANHDLQAHNSSLGYYFGSALEHGTIEQLQNSGLVGASTIKMLQVDNADGVTIYLANSNNWQTGPNIRASLTQVYGSDQLSVFDSQIARGDSLLLPNNAGVRISGGGGTWGGYGYVDHHGSGAEGMFVQQTYSHYYGSGGFVSNPYAQVNPAYMNTVYQARPWRRPFSVHATGADPVDVANGTFQVDHTDLSLGQPEPHGLTLGRYYNSLQRYNDPSGMGQGWVNNYYANAQEVPAPEASLGGTTSAQAAPMIVATASALALYNESHPDPKNWELTVLIAKWGMDQFTTNGISVQLGKDIMQFVRQPNNTFTPPANCAWTLSQSNNFVLQQRHGNTFSFDSHGRLTTVEDQYINNTPLTVSYLNSTSSLPYEVTDWKGRALTFNYSGTSPLLASVSDSTGRSVTYGYTMNDLDSNMDLTSVTGPDGHTSMFAYNGDHEITAVSNALHQLVTSNLYDGGLEGRLRAQYTEGNTNKLWHIDWSGWETVLQNPEGGQQRYFFDDDSRLVGFEDALGNLSQTFFDGQDHPVMTVSPLGETNRFVYDGNNNLLEFIDPLGFTNQFFYDNQNDLIRSVDGRGDVFTYGYNSEFSLTGSTNGAGDWVNFAYNTDGTLHLRTDSGGTTQYGYDSYGQLNNITYPDGLGSESFVNNLLGDPTQFTDANANVTRFYYDNRRDLTNTVAPTNVTFSVAFDAVGNVASTTDARGNVTSNSWSATRKLLTTALPPTPAGVPVLTRMYDNRDWLSKTLNPLGDSTLYTNNAAGWLVSQTDPVLRTTTFGFDADGRNVAATNAAQEATYRAWDGRNDLVQLTDGAGHTSLRAYDAAGNEIALTNRNGNVWRFQFDEANRLTNTIPPLPMQPASRTYNHQGLVSTAKDPAGQPTSFYYDAKGRLTNRTDNVGTTLYGYDANDNRTSVTENGLTNTWTYDAYNRISSYRDVYGNLIQYHYDANGNLTNLVYPSGKNVYYTYDNDNHLTQVRDWSGRITTLAYDLAGRLTSITRPNRTKRIVSYDAAGQATNILEETALGYPIADFRFNWNLASEIQWEFAGPLPHNNSVPTRTMTYNDDNELATFQGPTMGSAQSVTEDGDGNLTYGPGTNDNFLTYTYDARNRLIQVGPAVPSGPVTTNVYDAINDRIGQTYGTNSTVYVVDPNAGLPQMLERIKDGVTTYYIYGPGLLYQITETPTATNTLTYHYDFRGDTVALTDDNGNVTDRMEYSAYGTLTYRAGTSDTPFLFNGYYGVQTDPNGLLYMRARYYNPYICRFINPDPSGFAGGLNFYAFANGNPVSLIDPFGLGVVEGWGGATATWIGRNVVGPLNSVSTTSTTLNFASYEAASIIGGFADMLRLGQGTAYATYGAQNGWDVAIGVSQDVARAAGLSTLVAGGLQGAFEDVGRAGSVTRIGYHATDPANVDSILANGFNDSAGGRLGGSGVYVNNTPEGAIAEYMAVPGRPAPVVLQVEYTPGLNYTISPPPVGYTAGPLPFAADTLTTESIRLPGTFNTIIRNGSTTVVPSP